MTAVVPVVPGVLLGVNTLAVVSSFDSLYTLFSACFAYAKIHINLLFLLKLVKGLVQSLTISSRYWKVIINDMSSVTSKSATPVGTSDQIDNTSRVSAVCEDQLSGKSSVLEAITEIPFPRKENLCTRNESRDRP